MRVTLTAEQAELRAMLREVFADHCPTSLVRAMKDPASDGVPTGLWGVLARSGLLGLAVAPEYGGQGATLVELGLLFTEAGRALCPTSVYSALHFAVALGRLGTAEQRKARLPALCAGELRASVAAANPGDAGDLAPRLVAERSGDGWSLRGELLFVPDAAAAEVLLVTARYGAEGHGFLIRPGRDGCVLERMATMAGDQRCRVTLTGHRVDEQDHTGPLAEDDVRWCAQAALALQCMEMVGGAAAVLDRAAEHVRTRHQFGRPIGSFQAAQHHIADMRIAADGARLAAWQAVARLAPGRTATRAVAVAAMACAEAYKTNTLTAHQLHGGIGFVRETDLHLWSERAKTTEVLGGSADVAAGWLQRELGLVAR